MRVKHSSDLIFLEAERTAILNHLLRFSFRQIFEEPSIVKTNIYGKTTNLFRLVPAIPLNICNLCNQM